MDCGVQASHFRRFGTQVVSREKFIEKMVHGLRPTEQAAVH